MCSKCFTLTSNLWLINSSFDTCSVFFLASDCVFLPVEIPGNRSPLSAVLVPGDELPWKLSWDLALVNTHVWKNSACAKMTTLSPHMQDASWFVFVVVVLKNWLCATIKNKEIHPQMLTADADDSHSFWSAPEQQEDSHFNCRIIQLKMISSDALIWICKLIYSKCSPVGGGLATLTNLDSVLHNVPVITSNPL